MGGGTERPGTCKRSAAPAPRPRLTTSQTPCCTPQMVAVPSKLAVAMWSLPGDQQHQRMDLVCVSSRITAHRQPRLPPRCHRRTVRSLLQLASAEPVVGLCGGVGCEAHVSV
jgi:hypothetical protein